MPRTPSDNPQVRKHPNGQAVVTLSGRRIYLGVYGTEPAFNAYHRLTLEWREAGKKPLAPETIKGIIAETRGQSLSPLSISETTVADVANAYERDRRGKVHPGTLNGIEHSLRPLRDLFSATPAESFTPAMLKTVRSRMVDSGLCRRETNRRVRIIRAAFSLAVEEGMISEGPSLKLSAVRPLRPGEGGAESEAVEPVDLDELNKTIDAASAIVADMMRIQLLTGARPGEVCSMTFAEIDRTGSVWWFTPKKHKNTRRGKDRRIPLGPKAQAILIRYLDRPDASAIFSPRVAVEQQRAIQRAQRKTPLSCGNKPGSNQVEIPKRSAGDQYTTASYGRAVRRAAKTAGVEEFGVNRIRHTAATLIEREHGEKAAQLILGHSSPRTTGIYVATNVGLMEDVARAVG